MNPLPYDKERCAGRITSRHLDIIGGTLVVNTVGQAECARCRRREPGHPTQQPHMSPPAFVDGKCPQRIEP